MPEHQMQQPGPNKRLLYGLLFLYGIVLISGAIFIKREQFIFLLCWQVMLHICYLLSYKLTNAFNFRHLIVSAVLFRICLAFITPSLSEDVYRFIWDGQLLRHGDNPLLSTPDSYLANLPGLPGSDSMFVSLHRLINHPQYYTCYPPVMQFVFWLGALVGLNSIGVSVITIKLILALADCGTIYFLIKILKKLQLEPGLVILYALHPLVLVEGSGNAHFEVLQAALITGSLYFLLIKKNNVSALLWGLAIATKLLPLLLLPLFWFQLDLRKGFKFCCISVAVLLILFLPFLSGDAIESFSQSVNLFIQQFEFNASIYYLAREIGFWVTGYNLIDILGPSLLVVFLFIYALILFKKRSNDFKGFAFTALVLFCLYFLFSTTVHPWYIITLLPFAVITNNRFPFLWMSTAFLSYSAYSTKVVHENPWLITLEYSLVVILFIIEWKKNKPMFYAAKLPSAK